MKWIAHIETPPSMTFVIEEQEMRDVKTTNSLQKAFYIYVYENGLGTHDYLQDSLQTAKDFVFEKFQVPLDKWKQDK